MTGDRLSHPSKAPTDRAGAPSITWSRLSAIASGAFSEGQRPRIGPHGVGQRLRLGTLPTEHGTGRHWEQRVHRIVHCPSPVPGELHGTERAGPQALELTARQRRHRQDKGELAAGAQIKVSGADGKKCAQIVLRGEFATDVNFLCFGQLLEPLLEIGAHMAKGEPGRVADDDVGPAAGGRIGERARQIPCDVSPYRVATVRRSWSKAMCFRQSLMAHCCSCVISAR